MSHQGRADRLLRVSELSRVEGDGALRLDIADGRVAAAELHIYEPPRFFEALLRGRSYREPPDITARVCGICPVAYQMSACAAVEDACGVAVPAPLTELRRLLYCGEWIESHALHIHLLHAPDFLGLPDAIAMAREHRPVVERGLRLKKAGNTLLEVLGGRAIHPVNIRLGGFHRVPAPSALRALTGVLEEALDDALATVEWVAGFDFPDHECDHVLLALSDPDRYAIEGGRFRTDTGLSFPVAEFGEHVREEQVPHSTALHATLDSRRHLTGPLARYSLNHDRLPRAAKDAARRAGLGPVCRNPFRSIIVRAVEIVCAVEEALRILREYHPFGRSHVDVPARAGVGHGATEAPRGTLYHRYEIDGDGLVASARIVPPTAQNQPAIEHDLAVLASAHLDLDDAELTRLCERQIRNFDPCISCAAHFLTVTRRLSSGS